VARTAASAACRKTTRSGLAARRSARWPPPCSPGPARRWAAWRRVRSSACGAAGDGSARARPSSPGPTAAYYAAGTDGRLAARESVGGARPAGVAHRGALNCRARDVAEAGGLLLPVERRAATVWENERCPASTTAITCTSHIEAQ
jgi:hypothetical protein